MKLSEQIKSIFNDSSNKTNIKTILDKVELKSFGLLLIILSLPSALPVPAPGYSVPFGILLFILGIQIVMLRDYPWFPDKILNKEISSAKNGGKLVSSMVSFLSFFEKFLKPRMERLYDVSLIHIFLGVLVSLAGLSMIIPIPLTNTVPALGVFLIGLGMVEKDSLAGLAGVLVTIIGLAITITILTLIIVFAGNIDLAVDTVKDFIKSGMAIFGL